MPFFCKISMLVLILLKLFTPLISTDLSLCSSVAAAAVLICSITLMGQGFKRVTILFLMLGIVLLIYFKQPFPVWIKAADSMTGIISVMLIMQMFSIPVEAGKYNTAVQYWLTKSFKGEAALFLFSTVVTHIFSSFLMFGTIPVMVSLLGDTLKCNVSHYERFISAATSRGFALAVLWSPGAINLMLVMQATGVRWIEILVPGMILSLIGLIISYFVEAKLYLSPTVRQGYKPIQEFSMGETAARRKACHIVAVVVSIVVVTLLFEKLNLGSIATRIMFSGAIVALLWTMVFIRQPEFKTARLNYWHNGLLKTVELAPLFIAMGIFSTAAQQSGLLAALQPKLEFVANALGVAAFAVIPIVLIACAIAGIHPFISIVMFGQILTSLKLPMAPVSLALCLALGGCISYSSSPFAGIAITLAKFTDSRAIDIALYWNWAYNLTFFVAGIIFAYFWGNLQFNT